MSVGVEEIVVFDQEKQECVCLSFCHIEITHSVCSLNFLTKRWLQARFSIFVAKVFSVYRSSESCSVAIFSVILQELNEWLMGIWNFDVLLYMAISVCGKQSQMELMGLSHFRFLMKQQGNYRVLYVLDKIESDMELV